MITIILYGRNDCHGYNYHKRVAISLNCLAELLSDPFDEILFVDYNTADDFPTLPESIQDTLTRKAKTKLRIIRVRNEHHLQFTKITSVPVLEAIARNIAIRRSHPNNRWILSTNSDMIFVPLGSLKGLTEITENLEDGFYSLPRFELPEYFWESCFERSNPLHNLSLLQEYGKTLHLHKTIHQQPYISYNNTGDFQLMLREDILNIGGFNEEMLLSWNIDSNLSKRMYLQYKKIGTLSTHLSSYHCNHTRQKSLLHTKNYLKNNWEFFVESVSSPLANAHKSWGALDKNFEEFILEGYQHYFEALSTIQSKTIPKNYETTINLSNFNKLFYPSAQVFSYLVDHFITTPKNLNIVYLGYNYTLLSMLVQFLGKMGFNGNILLSDKLLMSETLDHSIIKVVNNNLLKNNNIYIFDFGFDDSNFTDDPIVILQKRNDLQVIINLFLEISQYIKKKKLPHKFVSLNEVYTDFRAIFKATLSHYVTSHNTNISYGYYDFSCKKTQIKSKLIHFRQNFFMKLINVAHYITVRYFFNYSDKIRNTFTHSKLAMFFLKPPNKFKEFTHDND